MNERACIDYLNDIIRSMDEIDEFIHEMDKEEFERD